MFSKRAQILELSNDIGEGKPLDAKIFRPKGTSEGDVSFKTAVLNFAQHVLAGSSDSLRRGKQAQAWLLTLLSGMYVATFVVGVFGFAVAAWRGTAANSTMQLAA